MDKAWLDERIAEYASGAEALRVLDNAIRADESHTMAGAISVGTDAIACHLQALHDLMIQSLVDVTPKDL